MHALPRLRTLLDAELAAGERLLAALETERARLVGDDPAALELAAGEKQRLAESLDGLDRERRTLLAGAGFDGDAMPALLRAHEDPAYRDEAEAHGPLGARWQRLRTLLGACRDANERNGLIVGLRSRQVRQVLNLLRTGRPDELTYGPGVAVAVPGGTRPLGRA